MDFVRGATSGRCQCEVRRICGRLWDKIHVARLWVAVDHAEHRAGAGIVGVAADGDIGLDFGVVLLEEGVEGEEGLVCHFAGNDRVEQRQAEMERGGC